MKNTICNEPHSPALHHETSLASAPRDPIPHQRLHHDPAPHSSALAMKVKPRKAELKCYPLQACVGTQTLPLTVALSMSLPIPQFFFFLTSLDAVRNWGHVCNIPDTHLGSCPLITTQGKQPGPQPWRKAATTEAITQSQSILPTTFQIR